MIFFLNVNAKNLHSKFSLYPDPLNIDSERLVP